MGRAGQGDHGRHLNGAAGQDWAEEERAGFVALMSELALLSAEGIEGEDDDLSVEDLIRQAKEQPRRQTPLQAFAADPNTPEALARRALDWDGHAVYGLWQMESPAADPGIWVRDLVLRIFSRLGADPVVTAEIHVDPAQDMVFGTSAQLLALAGAAGAAPDGWAKAWLDEPVPALQGLTPREAAASDDQMEVFRLESLLRQFEYQAGLAEAAGQEGMNVAWLRAELNIEEALDAIE